jgi:hypothetical protein
VDFLPTICKLTGVTVPASLQPDGEDVSDIWLGKPRARPKPLFWEWLFPVAGGGADGYMPPALTVRDGDWKLFVNHNGTGAQLYNIPKDAGEEHDVATANSEIVKALTSKAVAWSQSLPPSKARDDLRATGKTTEKAPNPNKAAANNPSLDRAAIFKKWDKSSDGKLSFDEYKAGIAKKEGAEQRFKNFDTNHDGVLSDEEFIRAGKPAPKQ